MKFYGQIKFCCAIVLLLELAFPIFSANAASLKLQVCIDSKGQITARNKCPKGQTLNSDSLGAYLGGIRNLTGPKGENGDKGDKGDKGDSGVPGVSDLVVSDGKVVTSIPKCPPLPGFPNSCLTPGIVTTNSSCPTDKLPVGVICVGKPIGDARYVFNGDLRGNETGQCSFFNNLPNADLVGQFYTRIICMSQPAF